MSCYTMILPFNFVKFLLNQDFSIDFLVILNVYTMDKLLIHSTCRRLVGIIILLFRLFYIDAFITTYILFWSSSVIFHTGYSVN